MEEWWFRDLGFQQHVGQPGNSRFFSLAVVVAAEVPFTFVVLVVCVLGEHPEAHISSRLEEYPKRAPRTTCVYIHPYEKLLVCSQNKDFS